MRPSLPLLTLASSVALALAAVGVPAGCSLASGTLPLTDAGPILLLPDGAPFVEYAEGGPTVACVFEELNTFSCPGVALAPPVWVTRCVDDDDCRTRVNGGAATSVAGCQETTAYQNVQELTTTCADWQAADGGATLAAIDSGPAPVCTATSVASFTPTWHPPRAPSSACNVTQIDSYRQCLNDAATTLSPPSCAEWAGTLSSADAACLACLTSNQPDAQYGPLVAFPTAVVVNLAGCVALAEGKTDGSGCGGAIQANEQCEETACLGNCAVGSPGLNAVEGQCEAAADMLPGDAGPTGVCASYAAPALCAQAIAGGDAGTTAAQQCFGGGLDAGTNAQFQAVALAFCGGG